MSHYVSQDSLRAGMQSIILKMEANCWDPELQSKTFNFDDLTVRGTFSDIYGRHVITADQSEAMREFVDDCVSMGAYRADQGGSTSFVLHRGGVYVFGRDFKFMNIDDQDTVTVYDDPSLRLNGEVVVKTGKDLNLTAYYNTGYPFDINSLSGEEYSDVTVYKMETDTTGYLVYQNRFPLHLKDVDHPLLAGIDSVVLKYEKPPVGPYLLRLESNWNAVANRDVKMAVNDTLRATVVLDKDAYNFKTEQAKMHMTMDYGYPHIYAVKPDAKPTIRVAACLLKAIAKEQFDTLFTDTLKLADDSLATKDLKYAGDWMIDWTKIDASKLAENDTTYQLKATIIFNGEDKFSKTFTLGASSSANINQVAGELSDVDTYMLNGVRINTRKPLKPGIYIRRGEKIVVK